VAKNCTPQSPLREEENWLTPNLGQIRAEFSEFWSKITKFLQIFVKNF
jgi:hypothetical protein